MTSLPSPQPSQARFDPSAPHHQRPRLRPVRGFPVQAAQNQPVLLGLADARQISDKMVVMPMQVQQVLPLLDGQRTLTDVCGEIGRGLTEQNLQGLIAQLDEAGLLFGPKFDAILAEMRKDFDSAPILPPAATATFADAILANKLPQDATEDQKQEAAPGAIREAFDTWMKEALENDPNPSFDTLPRAVMVPHIDYARGWLNYGSVWGRMRVVDRPDRVIILGTNHFGMGTGVTACDKGFQSPLGACQVDSRFLDALKKRLGPQRADQLMANRYDHEREHSIELQIPWIQHCLGADDAGNFVPVVGVLVHDPSVNAGESYDGQGLALQPFVEAMRAAIQDVGGRTLIISSADLSHVGPMFGDKQSLAGETPEVEQARNKVVSHDHDMLGHIGGNRPDDLVAAMAWQQNPTRWCSTGNIVAAMMIAQPAQIELLRYMAAMDPQGMGMVTSAGAVMR